MAEKTKKRSMTTDNEIETEVRSKNTPAITVYCHERQQNLNFRDYNFNQHRFMCQHYFCTISFTSLCHTLLGSI